MKFFFLYLIFLSEYGFCSIKSSCLDYAKKYAVKKPLEYCQCYTFNAEKKLLKSSQDTLEKLLKERISSEKLSKTNPELVTFDADLAEICLKDPQYKIP